jgi:hypothetical protein
MTLPEVVLTVMWVGVTLYAVFGGADFGAGLWDLVAGNARAGARQRELIEHNITPVWEANHVWLIFVLVVLWTGFPGAFAAIMTMLYVPLTAAAVGVILRGAGFAFRKSVRELRARRAFGVTFALSSVLTPFFLGAAAGAVASGRVPADPVDIDPFDAWVTPPPRSAARSPSPPAPTWPRRSSPPTPTGSTTPRSPTATAAPGWRPPWGLGPSRSAGSGCSTPMPPSSMTASAAGGCPWSSPPRSAGWLRSGSSLCGATARRGSQG